MKGGVGSKRIIKRSISKEKRTVYTKRIKTIESRRRFLAFEFLTSLHYLIEKLHFQQNLVVKLIVKVIIIYRTKYNL